MARSGSASRNLQSFRAGGQVADIPAEDKEIVWA